MALRAFLIAAVCSAALLVPVVQAEQVVPAPAAYNVDAILRALPDGSRWLQHLEQDLLPFWMMPTAYGQPVGAFPTYRCNDGSLYDKTKPCPELRAPIPGIVDLSREYMRAHGRQVFAYGVAFHMTGNKAYLDLAKTGVDDMMERAMEPSGSIASYFVDGKPGPVAGQRTSQDLAYAITAPAFYYYLTRDPKVLPVLEHSIDYGLSRPRRSADSRSDDRDVKFLGLPGDCAFCPLVSVTPTLRNVAGTRGRGDMIHIA